MPRQCALPMERIQPEVRGARLWFDCGVFDALMAWLGELRKPPRACRSVKLAVDAGQSRVVSARVLGGVALDE